MLLLNLLKVLLLSVGFAEQTNKQTINARILCKHSTVVIVILCFLPTLSRSLFHPSSGLDAVFFPYGIQRQSAQLAQAPVCYTESTCLGGRSDLCSWCSEESTRAAGQELLCDTTRHRAELSRDTVPRGALRDTDMEQGDTLIPEQRLSPCVRCEGSRLPGEAGGTQRINSKELLSKSPSWQKREALQDKVAALNIHLYLDVWWLNNNIPALPQEIFSHFYRIVLASNSS